MPAPPVESSAVGDPDLVAVLEGALPATLPPEAVSASLCVGYCFHRSREIRAVSLVVDGVATAPSASGMLRPGLVERLDDERATRSGFWGVVALRAGERGRPIVVEVEAELDDGCRSAAVVATIDVVVPDPPVRIRGPRAAATTAICMATFEPDPELFRRQVASLRDQTDDDWICLISDDCSRPESLTMIEEEVGGDARFVVSPSPVRLGFYRNFERALRMVPQRVRLVALSDQDDRWYPEKLATLRAAIGDSILVYSDQRRVDRHGRVISETLWAGRSRNHTDLASMLMANTIVGASSLFQRRLLELALPFPEGPGWEFHDHWLSIAALAGGRVDYVDRPLYDYVQHEGAIVGRVGVEAGARSRRPSIPRGVALRGRAVYFRSYLELAVQASTVLARAGSGIEPARRVAAERLLAADHSLLALTRLALRPLRSLGGHNETLGTESHLVVGLIWARIARLLSRQSRHLGRVAVETELPPFDLEGFGQRRMKRWLAGG